MDHTRSAENPGEKIIPEISWGFANLSEVLQILSKRENCAISGIDPGYTSGIFAKNHLKIWTLLVM
jgi:hypothetical protein